MKSTDINEIRLGFIGIQYAILGIFFYVLYKFIPIFFIQTICAICLVMAIYCLFRAFLIGLSYQKALKRHEEFEKIKKRLTKEHNAKTDSQTEDEKSQDDVDP
jgi:cell shape-determining protein MreD